MAYPPSNRSIIVLVLISSLLFPACHRKNHQDQPASLFSLIPGIESGIGFENQVSYTEEYNTYTYRNFYNGAGVALGDFNNDGMVDIYFCGNIVDNKLYINRGDFHFEDVTEQAGVACPGVWSTGVSVADVNGDGWLDIYVCKSGDPDVPNRNNELFINNRDLTFSEKAAEYGIADLGLSTHASFFDYDRDGDLDCYLLNNSFQSVTEFDLRPGQREIRDSLGANKLYRNEDGVYKDVSRESGIYGSKIGFGLGASAADVNRDGWMDLYVSNDFFERDYLYINNRDGTFTESLEKQIGETSLGAMGADIADINNDAWPEIFVTEMTAKEEIRLKTKVLFESWEEYRSKVTKGYHHQFARNVLQLNNRNGTFSEIGRLCSVDATDWSWGALIMDLDNDGQKDIFVANGIYKDLLDRDYLDLFSNAVLMRSLIQNEENAILSIIDSIPSERIPNYLFHNNGDLTFTSMAVPWGIDAPSHSNGAAYGDLDNDGDLDLVVNNMNMPSFIYRNETRSNPDTHYLMIRLKGSDANTSGIGAAVTLHCNEDIYFQEMMPMRGFKSSMDHRIHFGIGAYTQIDTLTVCWPDGAVTRLYNQAADQLLELDQRDAASEISGIRNDQFTPLFKEEKSGMGVLHLHKENDFNDFERDPLLFHMLSNEGPRIAVGDVNGDGRDDLYACGAKETPGELYIQGGNGAFNRAHVHAFESDRRSEDTDCAFFDADGDGYPDLYVTSGGNEFPSTSSALADRLYINDRRGGFMKSPQTLPSGRYESTSCVQPADYDQDGDMDLFVGVRLRPFLYGIPVNGYLLENDGKGHFSNVSHEKAPGLTDLGMVTDMAWADVDRDGDSDMIIVGDWMPVKIFINHGGSFKDQSEEYGLSYTEGWWHTVVARDLNGDGYVDLALGNHGLNSRFKASSEKPVTMYVNDFDLNGNVEQIICAFNGERSYPVAMKDDMVRQIPLLGKKYSKFKTYAGQTINDLFSQEVLARSVILKARILESCVMINSGTGTFLPGTLPVEAQFSPVYAIAAEDFNGDGTCDMLIGGNQYRAKPQTGIYAASYGLCLKGNRDGSWSAVPPGKSGFQIPGEIRDLDLLHINGKQVIVVVRNNDILKFYSY
jgi:hypothetical protein